MAGIFFAIRRIHRNRFKCRYLRSKNSFLNFLPHFWNLHHVFNFLKKKMTIILKNFQNYGLRKMCLDKCLKRPFSGQPVTIHMSKDAQHCWNLHDSTFIICLHQYEGNWAGICLSWVISEILGTFVYTLTVNDKYSLRDS